MLDALIRSAVSIANTVTGSLQTDMILHRSWQSEGGSGPIFAAPVRRNAIVEHKSVYRQLATGQTVQANHHIMILEPVHVDSRDEIVLPDPTLTDEQWLQAPASGPIMDVVGVIDPTTQRTYMGDVWLG